GAEEPGLEPNRPDLAALRLAVVDPRRPLVAGKLDHGLVAERARGAQRVARVDDPLDTAVAVLDLEQVFEAVDGGPWQAQLPLAAATRKRDETRPAELVRELHPAVAAVRQREERDLVCDRGRRHGPRR